MKTLRLLLFLLLMPFMAHAASPSFNSFLPTQFTNNGVVIGLNTNYVLTWMMVNTNYLTTNGNNLTVNTAAILALVSGNSNNIVVPPPNTGVLYNSNGVLRSAVGFSFMQSTTNVGIGTTSPGYMVHIDSGSRSFPQFVLTNSTASGANFILGTSGTSIGLEVNSGSAAGGSFNTFRGFSETTISLITGANSNLFRTMRLQNVGNRTAFRSYSDDNTAFVFEPLTITNRAPEGMLRFGTNGVLYFSATGQQIQWPDATRQITSGTNAVRVFGLDGVTVSPSNNTANGSIDFRISSTGDTNFPHVVVTNNVLYGTSLWTASSDATNYVLTLSANAERTINMTANVRVVGIDALAPAGFRGFVGVTVTNNSGSTFTVETTNTFRTYGTNSFSIPSGKDARIVFQIDENRVFYGGTVTP